MEKIRVLIVEDDIITANDIAQRLEGEGYEVTAVVDDGNEALEIVKNGLPDIALLDIGLGKDKMDGVETARRISKIRRMPFIFLTAFADAGTVKRAMETIPAAYLVKPVNDRQLLVSIDIAMTQFAQAVSGERLKQAVKASDHFFSHHALFVKKDRFIKVDLKNIYWVEAFSNYSTIITPSQKLTILQNLSAFHDELAEHSDTFARIHRSYVINIDHLNSFDMIHATVHSTELPIGRSYRDEFFRQIGYTKE